MDKTSDNYVAFRLPEDQARELSRLASQRGQSKGKLAKDIVTAALIDYSRFDDLSHRLSVVERALEHVVEQIETVALMQGAIDELRASLATATTRLLVEAGRVELEDAVAWTQEAYRVRTLS